METIKVNTSQHVDIDYPVAGIGERIVARLIDLGIFLAILIIFSITLTNNSFTAGSNAYAIFMIFLGICYVFYNLFYEIFLDGQSVGKKIMKIKVISIDGSQASVGQYFIRWIFRVVDFPLTAQIGGMFCVILSDNKQRIGDIVAGTTVIRTSPRTTLENIAFHPVEEDYTPTFGTIHLLGDRDAELLHEVLATYYKTGNYDLIHAMAVKVAAQLSVSIPADMHELDFLTTVAKDYNHITSQSE